MPRTRGNRTLRGCTPQRERSRPHAQRGETVAIFRTELHWFDRGWLFCDKGRVRRRVKQRENPSNCDWNQQDREYRLLALRWPGQVAV